jgi:hypothetical protein
MVKPKSKSEYRNTAVYNKCSLQPIPKLANFFIVTYVLFSVFCVLFLCECALYCCHSVAVKYVYHSISYRDVIRALRMLSYIV